MAKWIRVKQEDFDKLSEMWRWYERTHGRVEKFNDDQSRRGPREEHDKRVWYRAKALNTSVGNAPAYGVVKIADFEFDDVEGREYLTFTKPDAANLTNCALVWHNAIENGKFGRVTLDPWFTLYNTAATPTFDEDWGTSSGSWLLHSGNTGFKILGAATEGRVLVRRPESGQSTAVNVIKFSLTQALTVSDETATASLDFVVTGEGPSGAFSVTNMEASSGYAFSGGSGVKGYAIQRESNGAWLILQMECG